MASRTVLVRDKVTVRPLQRADEAAWLQLRRDNHAWLRPWEALNPPGEPERSVSFGTFLRRERTMRRERRAYPMVIAFDGVLVGRVSLTGVEWGAMRSGSLGYWVAHDHAGRGIVPTAVAMLSEYSFNQGLHRLEIAVRPENTSSLRVAQKLGFREEGIRRKYLYIDGAWRDHQVFALTVDEPRLGPYWGPGS